VLDVVCLGVCVIGVQVLAKVKAERRSGGILGILKAVRERMIERENRVGA